MINGRPKHQAAAAITRAMKRFTPFYDCLTMPIEGPAEQVGATARSLDAAAGYAEPEDETPD